MSYPNSQPYSFPDCITDILFVILACAAGFIDSMGYVGIGKVFISAVTGNTVIIANSLVDGYSVNTILSLFSFLGYFSGVSFATFMLKGKKRNIPGWSKYITYALGIETFLLFVLCLEACFYNKDFLNIKLVMVLTASLSMGIQYICAKHVNRADIVTTMITGTLSMAFSRLINRNEKSNTDSLVKDDVCPTRTTEILFIVWGGYFTGAAISSGLLNLHFVPMYVIVIVPFGLLLFVFSFATFKQSRCKQTIKM